MVYIFFCKSHRHTFFSPLWEKHKLIGMVLRCIFCTRTMYILTYLQVTHVHTRLHDSRSGGGNGKNLRFLRGIFVFFWYSLRKGRTLIRLLYLHVQRHIRVENQFLIFPKAGETWRNELFTPKLNLLTKRY